MTRELSEETGYDGAVERLLGVDSRVIPAAVVRAGVEHQNVGVYYRVRITGAPYSAPPYDRHPNFIQVRHALWTQDGLIGKLTAPGLAMFLIVTSYYNPNTNKGEDLWFSEKPFRERHGFAEATARAG